MHRNLLYIKKVVVASLWPNDGICEIDPLTYIARIVKRYITQGAMVDPLLYSTHGVKASCPGSAWCIDIRLGAMNHSIMPDSWIDMATIRLPGYQAMRPVSSAILCILAVYNERTARYVPCIGADST